MRSVYSWRMLFSIGTLFFCFRRWIIPEPSFAWRRRLWERDWDSCYFLTILDHFCKTAEKIFVRSLKVFLVWFEVHWMYNSQENELWKKVPKMVKFCQKVKGLTLTFWRFWTKHSCIWVNTQNLSLFFHTPEVMTRRILRREIYKTLIFPLAFGIKRPWPLVTWPLNLMALGSNPIRDILQWLRGRIVSPSVVGILLACSDNPWRKSHLFS